MSKAPVAIATDSTCGLPEEVVARYNIHVIPQIVNWEGQSILDGIDITPTAFYERLATAREMPTTSQPSVGEFHDFFSKVGESAESIVGIFVSDALSGTLSSARTAVEMLDIPITLVDSRFASMGLGLIVLETARAVADGASAAEAAQRARDLVGRTRIMFVVDTLEFLHRGGRIGGAQRLIGSMLSMKPILHLVDGRIEPLKSVRTKRKALAYALDQVTEELSGKQKVQMAVLHANAPDVAQELVNDLRSRVNPQEILVSDVSPVIGTHVGPGTVGVAYTILD